MAVPPAPSQRTLALSVTSVTSVTNDKGDNQMIPGLCTDLLAFALQPWKMLRVASWSIDPKVRVKVLDFAVELSSSVELLYSIAFTV